MYCFIASSSVPKSFIKLGIQSRRVRRVDIETLKARAVGRRPKIWSASRAWIARCIRASLETGSVQLAREIR
jgi:hypothetical protein